MDRVLTVYHKKNGEFDVDIEQPTTEAMMDLLIVTAARIVAMVAIVGAEQTEFICHKGCAFAAVMEEAHKYFAKLEPAEYKRVIDAKMIAPTPTTGSAH